MYVEIMTYLMVKVVPSHFFLSRNDLLRHGLTLLLRGSSLVGTPFVDVFGSHSAQHNGNRPYIPETPSALRLLKVNEDLSGQKVVENSKRWQP